MVVVMSDQNSSDVSRKGIIVVVATIVVIVLYSTSGGPSRVHRDYFEGYDDAGEHVYVPSGN